MGQLEVLAHRWSTGKERIKELKEELIAIEKEMLPLVESVEGGSKTTKAEGWKIVVKRPIYWKFSDNWGEIRQSVGSDFWPVKVKEEVDASGVKWVQENAPDEWKKLAAGLVATPGKPSFVIEDERQVY